MKKNLKIVSYIIEVLILCFIGTAVFNIFDLTVGR
jgi:hypothetical protein